MKKKITLSGSMLVFFGALFWSLNAPLVKFLQVDALLTCGLRSLIAGVFLLPYVLETPVIVAYGWMICGLAIVSSAEELLIHILQKNSVGK